MSATLTWAFSILAAIMLFLHGLAAFSEEVARLGGERLPRVVSGLAVLAVGQGIVAPSVAVWMVAGANVGTTSTALLASTALDTLARKLALLNTAFNLLGVALFATLLQPVIAFILTTPLSASEQVALAHTVFNLAAALIALLLLPRAWLRLASWLEREM